MEMNIRKAALAAQYRHLSRKAAEEFIKSYFDFQPRTTFNWVQGPIDACVEIFIKENNYSFESRFVGTDGKAEMGEITRFNEQYYKGSWARQIMIKDANILVEEHLDNVQVTVRKDWDISLEGVYHPY